MGFFGKISQGLRKTRESLLGKVEQITAAFVTIDEDFFEEIEETLILADVGMSTAEEITARLRAVVKKKGVTDPKEVTRYLKEVVAEMLEGDCGLHLERKPAVILIIGVNGVGKTTTIGKLANSLREGGNRVILAAADTFRAAAIDQLQVWSERAGVELIRQSEGSDPAAVVFDAIAAGKARRADVILCDTAGRLHNKKNLMEELSKISRVIARELPESDVEVLLVLDATTGQNALSQAKSFGEAAGLTGIVLTKLDGTARGGVIIGIRQELGIPIKYIGVGEKLDDLRPFDPLEFANALFEGVGDPGEEDEEKNRSEEGE